jgi:hypothetical protein
VHDAWTQANASRQAMIAAVQAAVVVTRL